MTEKKDTPYKRLKRERDECIARWGEYMKRAHVAEAKIEDLKKENAVLREALEFYASGDYWGYEHPSSDIFNSIDSRDLGIGDFQLSEDADDDGVGGRTAREALEKVKSERAEAE